MVFLWFSYGFPMVFLWFQAPKIHRGQGRGGGRCPGPCGGRGACGLGAAGGGKLGANGNGAGGAGDWGLFIHTHTYSIIYIYMCVHIVSYNIYSIICNSIIYGSYNIYSII